MLRQFRRRFLRALLKTLLRFPQAKLRYFWKQEDGLAPIVAAPLGRLGYNVGEQGLILIAEDNPDEQILLKRAFRKAGVLNPVQAVSSGTEAIAYLSGKGKYADRSAHPFPAILMLDLQMPEGDGFEVLRWLRQKVPAGELLIIVLSGMEELEKVNQAYALGANSFLTKPGKTSELQELIKEFSGYWLVQNRPPKKSRSATPKKLLWGNE